jgi:hypothetical protein
LIRFRRRFSRLRQSRQHIGDAAAKIDIDRRAGRGVKDQDRGVLAPVEPLFGRARDLAQIARRDSAVAFESDGGVRLWVHGSPFQIRRRYYQGNLAV